MFVQIANQVIRVDDIKKLTLVKDNKWQDSCRGNDYRSGYYPEYLHLMIDFTDGSREVYDFISNNDWENFYHFIQKVNGLETLSDGRKAAWEMIEKAPIRNIFNSEDEKVENPFEYEIFHSR